MTTIYLDNAYIDIQKDFIDKYLTSIDENFKKNPQFISELFTALHFLTRKKDNEVLPPFELNVYDDGRGFEIRSGIRKCPDNINPELQNNKNFDMVKFTLDDKNNIELTQSNGVFYKFEDYAKIEKAPELKSKYEMLNSRDTPTVISTYHTHTTILSNGIEVEKSSYSDQYPLGLPFESDSELKNQTMIHSPRQWYFNSIPERANWEFNPFSTNSYRFTETLGLVVSQFKSGKSGMVEGAEYPANTEYPDKLGCFPTPVKKYANGKEEITPEYQESFPGKSVWDVEKEVNISFRKGIDTSKTKDINPIVYENLKNVTDAALERRYGYTLETEEETYSPTR